MELKNWIEKNIKIIDSSLEAFLPEINNRQVNIYKSMRYSLLSGGKRIRPLLMIASYEIYEKPLRDILPFACALEMIHAYSLIHDDLPSMDDDDFRRGKPTNHKVFGEAMAILAGDGLLNKAFETVLNNCSENSLNTSIIFECLQLLASASGTEGMIGGQVVDMFIEEKNIDYLEYMHRLKTGALIKAACQIGATAGGATEKELQAISAYAEYVGLAFQVKDDILDYTADEEELGKPVNSDEKNKKLTYVSLMGLDKSEILLKEYTTKAIESLSVFDNRGKRLKEIAEYLLERRK
jgi:geranylgeranyl diphosphate synthase type II